jgi:hypothetical protein
MIICPGKTRPEDAELARSLGLIPPAIAAVAAVDSAPPTPEERRERLRTALRQATAKRRLARSLLKPKKAPEQPEETPRQRVRAAFAKALKSFPPRCGI